MQALTKALSLLAHIDINLTLDSHIRCAGHDINFFVKATLYGQSISMFERELAAAALLEYFRLFRKLGIVGKLHHFVNAICASHKRRVSFLEIQNLGEDKNVPYSFDKLNLR
jgi:hypothetical protein